MPDRTDFTTPPRLVIHHATQPSWKTPHALANLRRIFNVNSTRVSPRCWRWLTGGPL